MPLTTAPSLNSQVIHNQVVSVVSEENDLNLDFTFFVAPEDHIESADLDSGQKLLADTDVDLPEINQPFAELDPQKKPNKPLEAETLVAEVTQPKLPIESVVEKNALPDSRAIPVAAQNIAGTEQAVRSRLETATSKQVDIPNQQTPVVKGWDQPQKYQEATALTKETQPHYSGTRHMSGVPSETIKQELAKFDRQGPNLAVEMQKQRPHYHATSTSVQPTIPAPAPTFRNIEEPALPLQNERELKPETAGAQNRMAVDPTLQRTLVPAPTLVQAAISSELDRHPEKDPDSLVGALQSRTHSDTHVQQVTTSPPQAATQSARAIAAQMAVALTQNGPGTMEIALSPEELGRLRMVVSVQETSISVLIQADRPETSDLMRRHIETLSQEFKGMGFTSTSFTFAGGNGQHAEKDAGTDEFVQTQPTELPEIEGLPASQSNGLDLRL